MNENQLGALTLMTEHIKTIVTSTSDISSNAEDFYRKYWSETNAINEAGIAKKKSIISKFFPAGLSGNKILEIGVGGEGGIILHLAKDNQVYGLDVSDSAISNCRRFGLDVAKANLDSAAIPYEDEYFDIVFAFEVFEHFCNPQHAIEEIRRTLKTGGIFISSIPSTYTYHWPRLFYPSLFELENYKDFLMINGFRTTNLNDWMMTNQYGIHNLPGVVKSWSWYWHAEKLSTKDANSYFDIGMHFWRKRDQSGLRTRPVEAIDMLRKALEIAPDDERIRLQMAHATVYRFLNNDQTEFPKLLEEIYARLMFPDGKNKADYLARLLLINLEANRLGFRIMEHCDYEKLKAKLLQDDACDEFLSQIAYEENVNTNLKSLE